MGILIMMMPFVFMAVLFLRVAMPAFLRTEQVDPKRGIYGFGIGKQILHKFLQTGAGDHDPFRGLCGLDLTNVQRIVVQAGNLFRHQPGNAQTGALTQAGGKFIYRQRGSGDLRRWLRGRTAAKKNYQKQG